MSGAADRPDAARAAIVNASVRAVQSTPILDRTGSVIAMVSTHFQTPHEPSEKHLRLLDALLPEMVAIFTPSTARDRLLASL